MKKFNMKRARQSLRQAILSVDPLAEEFIDWDAFEIALEAMMECDPTREMVLAVFGAAITKARQLRAVHSPIGATN